MRSFAVAIVSSLLLSPISVLATYHHDGEHTQYTHVNEHGHEHDHHELDHSHYKEHSVVTSSGHSNKKIVRIIVDVDVSEKEVDSICRRKEETCLKSHDCDESKRLCRKKTKCREQKNTCFKDYKCRKSTKKCSLETTKRYGFRCGKKFYSQAKVIAAAKAACPKISKNAQKSAFPAPHTAFEFYKAGPYVEWPVTRTGRLWAKKSKSKHRIVMTMDCTVVGAVVRHKHAAYSRCKYERQ